MEQGMSTSDILQLIALIVSVLGGIGGVVWWLLQRYIKKLNQEIRVLKGRKERLEEKVRHRDDDLVKLRTERNTLEDNLRDARKDLDESRQQLRKIEDLNHRNSQRAEELEKELHHRIAAYQDA